MPKLDPSNAPQAPAAVPAPATPAKTPEPSAKIQEPGGGTPAAANAPPVSAEPVDVREITAQLLSASMTGNTKEASRLQGILDNRPTGAEPDPEPAAEAPAEPEPGEGETPGDPEDTAPADPDAETPADPDADPDAEPEPEPVPGHPNDKKLPERIRIGHLTKEEQAQQTAIHALTMGGMPLAEAQRRVMGTSTTPAAEDPDFTDDPTHQAPPTQAVADLETRVGQLKQELKARGTTEGVYNEEIADLTDQLIEANADLREARRDARDAQRDQKAHTTQVKSSEAKAFARFPAAQDKASPLYQRFLEKCLAANHPSHPDHERSFAADAPEYFLAKAAGELGIKPVASNARTVPVPPAQAVRGAAPANGAARPNGTSAPVTRPAPGSRTSAPAAPPKTSAQRAAEAQAELEAATTGQKRPANAHIGGLITFA